MYFWEQTRHSSINQLIVIMLFGNLGTLNIETTSPLDFESVPQYTLTVDCSDGQDTSSSTLVVDITDVNEAPSATGPASVSVSDDLAGGAVLYTLVTSDPESDTLSYAITQTTPSGGPFSVDTSGKYLEH